jgi:hypothetical protein
MDTQEGAMITRGEEGMTSPDNSQSMMDLCNALAIPSRCSILTAAGAPTAIPTELNTAVRDHGSPTPTAGSAVSENTRKQNLTLTKAFRGSSKALPPTPTPLPPMTPTKAAKFLGVEPESSGAGSSRAAQHDAAGFDGIDDDMPRSRYGWPQQHSMPTLTTPESLFHDEDSDTEAPKAKGFWNKSKTISKKMSEPISSLLTPPKSNRPMMSLPDVAGKSIKDLESDFVNSIGLNQPNYPIQDVPEVPDRPAPPVPSRRRRRRRTPKGQRKVQPMAPITEASHDDMSAAYHYVEDSTELDVIDEYARGDVAMGGPVYPQRTESLTQTFANPFELSQVELLPAGEDGEDEKAVHPGTPVDLSKLKMQQHSGFPVQSPLQVVEARLLDVAEKEIELEKLKKEVVSLKTSHETLKKEFAAMTVGEEVVSSSESDSDDDLPCIRSSIDLDEEPTLHTAIAMPILRVTPGMVKLIDIPARRKSKSSLSSHLISSRFDEVPMY